MKTHKSLDMHNVFIRPALLADLPILYDFEQGIIAFERPYDDTLKPDPINYYDIKAMIGAPECEVIVAAVGEEIVASAYAKIVDGKPYHQHEQYAYLGFMFVKVEYRGKGINGKIIDALKVWIQSKNIDEIRLDVYNDNHGAVRAYEKAGFVKQMVNMRMNLKK